MQRIWQVVTTTVTALLLGTSFAHVLEWPAKLKYEGALYVQLQTSLYAHWGPPGIGGFIEPAAILAVFILALLVRKHGLAFRLTLVAGGCLLLAFPVVFFWRVAPANAAFLHAATTGILPPDWTAWRTQWETGHALRFVLHGIAFVLIAVSLTIQRTRNSENSSMTKVLPPQPQSNKGNSICYSRTRTQ